MNAVIKRTGFAAGNYVIAKAFANTELTFVDFNATSRLIGKVKAGAKKLDALCITAIERSDKRTRASQTTVRELTILLPDSLDVGEYEVKGRDDVGFSLKNDDGTVYEGISGNISITPASEGNVKGSFNVNIEMPNTEEQTFILKGDFKVLKAG
jgi:hypothetical protein